MKIKVFDSKTLKNIIEVNLALVGKVHNEYIIGRSPESSIVLDSPDVSRMHAKLILENGNYYFCDLGSTNGSLINGNLAETSHNYLLNPGDIIRLGEFVLILEDVNVQLENTAETVYRSLDATVVASLRDSTSLNELNQIAEVEEVPEFVNSVPQEVVSIPEEVPSYQETSKVQKEEISVPEEVTKIQHEEILVPQEITKIQEDGVPVSEEINEVVKDVEIPEVPLTTSEPIVATDEKTLESEVELRIPNTQEVHTSEEKVTAATPIVEPIEQTPEEVNLQPKEEIRDSEIVNVLSLEEVSKISEPEIAQLQEVSELEIDSTDVTYNESCELSKEETTYTETPRLISTRYIVLLAHETKKIELAQFVSKHKGFFSKCLTIAPPSVSEVLSSQAGINITEQTSTTTSGGYQAIAAKVGSGDVLAVLFLRDFLQAQSSTANEEAMLRVCNINDVMVATNLSTAEAIVAYVQGLS